MQNRSPLPCEVCGKITMRYVNAVQKPRFCSRQCAGIGTSRGRHPSPEERFSSKVSRGEPQDCWPYMGGFTGSGYGAFWINGKQKLAHIHAYEMANGPIPKTDEKIVVRHTCDNPSCCNPGHLLIGTPKDNTRDMLDRKRNKIGGKKKVTEQDVLEIRNSSLSNRCLGRAYGINEGTIRHIRARRTWKHLT